MKALLTSIFLLFVILSNAQTKKGDLYIGTSVLNYSRNENKENTFTNNSYNLSPSFGVFVADKTLIGVRLSPSIISFTQNNTRQENAFIGWGFFAAQYLGKGKLQGLTGLNFNTNRFQTTSDLRLGGAYFFNDFSAIEFTYNIAVLGRSQSFSEVELFPNGLRPFFGLTLRSFFLRNREGVENLAAVNSIKKGTLSGLLSGRFSDLEESRSYFLSNQFKYFLRDNFFIRPGISLSRSKLKDESLFNFSSFSASLELGYYLPIKDNFFGKFSVGMRGGNSANLRRFFSGGNLSSEFETKMTSSEVFSSLGAALFIGRHKIESNINASFIKKKFKEPHFTSRKATNIFVWINYEYFLSANFSITGNLGFFPNQNRYSSTFSFTDDAELSPIIREDILSNTNLSAGFKWYFDSL